MSPVRFMLLFLVVGYLPVCGQTSSISWDAGLEYGRIIKHSPKIAFPIPERSYGFGLQMLFQTNGRKEWHQHHGYPLVGVSLQYFELGDSEVLGQAIAFYPTITLKLAERRKWMFHFRVGSGLSWVTRPYDRLTNPTNNSIGSRLNNATHFRLAAGFPLSESWAAFAGFSFSHFSNGTAQLPNLGINVPAVSASIRYTPSPLKELERTSWDTPKRPPRRLAGQAYLALAYKESNPPGAAKWPVYKASAAGIYRISKVQNLQWGVEYEFQQSVYHFSLHTFAARSQREAREDASRWMLFLGNEWNFGNVGLLVQAGYYLSRRSSVLVPFPFYNKLGLRYYLPPAGRPATRFFAGIYLKSHIITAEYISIGIGARVQ